MHSNKYQNFLELSGTLEVTFFSWHSFEHSRWTGILHTHHVPFPKPLTAWAVTSMQTFPTASHLVPISIPVKFPCFVGSDSKNLIFTSLQ